MVSETLSITYLFDPLCGWCYGASPVLHTLNALDEFSVVLTPTGLFADDNARAMNSSFAGYAWSNDQRIAQLTGQPFSENYQRQVLTDYAQPFDSGPATRALSAVAITAPAHELQALNVIQQGRYVEGLDITDLTVLAQLLRGAQLDTAADRLLDQDEALLSHYRQRIASGQATMAQLGTGGVPALVLGNGTARRLVSANALFAGWDALLINLRAGV